MAKELTRDQLFARFVGNIGTHCVSLHTDNQQMFRMSAVPGLEDDMVTFRVDIKGETPDVWDRCYHVHADGTEEWVGNRCGMVAKYTEMCAKALQTWLASSEQ